MAAPVPNGPIPIMASGGPQSAVIYQQQPVVVGAQPHGQLHYNHGPGRRNFGPRNPNEEQCKIFVGGVGKNTTEDSLRAYFRKFGEIADSVIMQDRETGEPRGFAFVTFKSTDAVQAVIDQCNEGGHTLDGKVIDPKPAVPQGPAQQTKISTMKVQAIHSRGVAGVAGHQQYRPPMQIPEDLKVFVGGIGIGTTEEDVRNYFNTFGKVEAVDMPFHKIYNCPKGFGFVGFDNIDSVNAIIKDRYHQINGKTVEVKGAEEQRNHVRKKRQEGDGYAGYGYRSRFSNPRFEGPNRSHVQPGTIGTISGHGAYANLAAAHQQVLIPQIAAGGQMQYAAMQLPSAAAAGGGYVFDPSTNTYYQLPATMLAGAGSIGAATAYPYGGVQIMANPAIASQMASQIQVQMQVQAPPDDVAAGMIAGISGAEGQLRTVYPNETSTFGPSRTHILGSGQQPIAGTTVADPHVVYSNAAALSAGESVPSRGFHPYGR